ncbi:MULTISPECIES: hypothetical protein [Bacteroidales]
MKRRFFSLATIITLCFLIGSYAIGTKFSFFKGETVVETESMDDGVNAFSDISRPTIKDFDDFFWNGMVWISPEEAVPLEGFSAIVGGWKALMLYDPLDENDKSSRELLNCYISGTMDEMKVTMDWYWKENHDGTNASTEHLPDLELFGRYVDKNFLVSCQDAALSVSDIYVYKEKQCMIGTWHRSDELQILVYMTRP